MGAADPDDKGMNNSVRSTVNDVIMLILRAVMLEGSCTMKCG
ncbi:hypothetical protein BEI_2377 [Halomonas beimenensis]|uniref:Uncharacterized protein n=1 Tax=Halomonas beimenensis TaxID=475662 RepID=A0A291P900_9GAMM|nr:hypothetical protein BEI_2377 [Halomonas beimenensis]